MKLIVLLLLAATIISAVTANTTTNLVSVNSPVANQKLIPNEQVTLQHAILGTAKSMSGLKAYISLCLTILRYCEYQGNVCI
jgi:hypothetical protein